jgi:hypothetical protein
MAITTLAGLKTQMLGARKCVFYKPAATAEGAGTFHSLWTPAGFPGAGATPPLYTAGSGYIPTNATTGAISLPDPPAGKDLRLAYVDICAAVGSQATYGSLIVYDRLWHCSGIPTEPADTYAITTPEDEPITRGDLDGRGVEMWLETYDFPGATGGVWDVAFLDAVNSSVSTATYAHPANSESVGQMMLMRLPEGTSSVQYPIEVVINTGSGSAGNVGITLLRRIASIPIGIWYGKVRIDFLSLGLPKIETGACLACMWQCNGTATPVLNATLWIIEN